MLRALLVIILIAGAAYVVYQNLGRTPSDEELLVTSLSDRYAVLVNKFLSAVGRSGAIGMDTTFDSETTAVQMQRLRAELAELRKTLTDARAVKKAGQLAEKIENFCKKNDITRP
jgi:hypothetical protein